MLNHATIMGRLTRDPELRAATDGTPVTSFSLAVERDVKGSHSADFIDVVAWGPVAEFVCKYFAKGRTAVVEGRVQTRQWEDREGNKRRSTEIVAGHVYFGDSKRPDQTQEAAPELPDDA